MSVLIPADFKGKFLITKNTKNIDNIQSQIDETEFEIMNELLGPTLLAEYVIGINNSDPLFEKIRDPFFVDACCGQDYKSNGIKKMLLGFTFYDYYQTDVITASLTGQQVTKSENSEKEQQLAMMANNSIYNDAVKTFNAIQKYLNQNRVDYPNFKGINIKLLASIY